ncbi:MAG TPA: kelch repeat-containing protein [Pyrinomonadaceae bacterium]|nr:kelch repeat-containing protein [Pyrinomonadaceae bacterium]
MKIASSLTVMLLVCSLTLAQNPDCRQSWMPPDTPAFCAWETEPSLPEARTYHSVVRSDRYVYVLGGFRFDAASSKVIYYDSVVRSTIGGDGHLSAWTAEPSFKNGRGGAGAAAIGQCLFVSGGSSSSAASVNYYDDIQYARIGGGGRLSSWTTSPNRLKTPRSNHSLVAVRTDQGNFLHIVAGVTQIGPDTVHLDTIEFAGVRDDCSIGAWTTANFHLKGGRSSPQALVVRNNVVVIGGWGDLDLIDVFNDIQTAAPRSNGSPAPWRTALGGLTTGIYGHATVFAELTPPKSSLLLSTGGQPGTGAYSNWISYAYVLAGAPIPDGIGQWRISPNGKLPTGRAGLGSVELGARLYVIGGSDASGQYYRDVLSSRFDFGQP